MSTSHSRRDSDRALQLDASPPRGRGMWAEMQHLLGDAFGGSSPASEAAEREGGLDFARQGPSPMGADSPVTIFQGSRSQSPVDRRERDRGLPASGADADASALLQLLEPGLGVSKIGFVTGPLPLTGHGAGDKSPHVEMEVIWTPEEVAKRGPEDPLLLAPEKDRPLQLLAGMAATLPGFADAFSSASMGFFLQQEDYQRMELGKRPDSSSAEKVKAYNQILNRIKNLLWASPVDYTELGYLLDKAKDLERRAGQGELRRIVAFQDECLPDIGEWSTDRRRQLRNQVFLAKLDDHGKVGNMAEVLEHDLSILLAPFFLLVAAAFSCYNMWLLMNSPERDLPGGFSLLIGRLEMQAVGVRAAGQADLAAGPRTVEMRLDAGPRSSTAKQYSVTVRVVKQDSFGAEPARVDVSFVPPGHSENQLMVVSFPGTNGNAGIMGMPMGLQHGADVNITGYEETDAGQATTLKAGMKDAALGAAIPQVLSSDKRNVFVMQQLEYVTGSGTDTGSRRLAGNAAASNTAVVVLYQPCGNNLAADITNDRLQSAFFGTEQGSFQQVLNVCSRGTVSFSGAVVGPIDGCPDSTDAWATYSAINDQLKGTPEWDNNYFKLMILPAAWLSAVGLGTVGGGISWYRESYVSSPVLFLHEIGHNWKLHHAGGAFTSQEYSDTSSAMGYCCRTRCYNFLHSWQLGFADYDETSLSLSELVGKSSSTSVTINALGQSFTSGVKILTDSSSSGRRLNVPAFLALSWRSNQGTDEYLQGTSYGNKVQVHHWDGDTRTDADITHLLHNVDKGSTILVQDTDRSGNRIETDLKLTVKGTYNQASDTVEVLLCKRLDSESQSSGTLTPCAETGSPTTAAPTTTTTAATTAEATTTTTAGITGATVSGQMTVTVSDCSLLSGADGITGLKNGLALALSMSLSDSASMEVSSCARRLAAGRRLAEATLSYIITFTSSGASTPAEMVARIKAISTTDMAAGLNTGLVVSGVSTGAVVEVTAIADPVADEPSTTTTTTGENPGGAWSAYFTDETSSRANPTSTAITGVGCMGQFCGSVRLGHRADVELDTQVVTVQQLEADVGDLICQSGQVATQVICVGTSCSKIELHCATPKKGRVSADVTEMAWFPAQLHATQDSWCYGEDVVVGVYCGGAQCANKKLVCAKYSASEECVPQCSVLGLECGDDGCGGSCGTCTSQAEGVTPVCRGDVGRCIQFVTSDWASTGTQMKKTQLVSTGMGCTGRYCENVNLVQMSVHVDASVVEKSGWISDNSGHRWPWNSGTAAEDQAADCPSGMAVSFGECDGKYCDNLRFECGKPLQWVVDMSSEPVVTDWFSEEEQRMDCPDGKVVTGVECQASKTWCISDCGSYCDNKRLRCRSIKPQMAGAAVLGIVAAADMPTGAAPAPPAPSPWWEGAGDSIGDAWNQFTSGDAAVGGAQQLLASCGLVAGAAWGFGWLKVKEIKLTCGL
ncbi:unnamed protein product [Effrenium voratum]|nr:unnamed protein product [Effrenium voratum]